MRIPPVIRGSHDGHHLQRAGLSQGEAQRMRTNGSAGRAVAVSATQLRPAAVSATAPEIEAAPAPAPAGYAFKPAPGPYLGGAEGDSRHRISFTLLDGSLRNLRVDGLGMAHRAPV